MGVIRFKKVIGNLPAQLEPDTVYAVRTGTGFDLYISDATGSVAHGLNLSTTNTVSQLDLNKLYAISFFFGGE